MPAHRKAVVQGYREVSIGGGRQKRLHIVRAERALGRPLPKGAEVHHADLTKDDDAPLVICQSHRYHRLLHARTRVLRAGGDPNRDAICADCKRLKPRTEFYSGPYRVNQCKVCIRARMTANYRRRVGLAAVATPPPS